MWIGLVLFLVLLIIPAIIILNGTKSWTFEESDRSIANPDRGFYIQVKSSHPERISDIAEDVRVTLLSFDIEEYTEGELPKEKLEELRIALETAKKERVAVVFRAAYGFRGDVTEPEQIELESRHIEQMAEVLNDYTEQILVVQAGMLGAYGEWHSSRYLNGTEEENRESRLYILKKWEEYLNSEVKVAVRRQRFVREAMEENILSGRLGIHNDALLSTDSDMGTYDEPGMERKDELAWTTENLAGQVNGGEMPTLGELSSPQNADYEFRQLHISYLNLKYNEDVINEWSEMTMEGMNAKQYMENHLGYRLFISELDMREVYLAGELSNGGIKIKVCLCNTGYAQVPQKYKMFITAEAGGEQICQEVDIPELYNISNGQMAEKVLKIRIPKEFLDEEEGIAIGLKIAPDKNMADGQDCVELANDGCVYHNGVNRIVLLERKRKIFMKAGTMQIEKR